MNVSKEDLLIAEPREEKTIVSKTVREGGVFSET